LFHLCERLKFRTAVWHGFVVVAATLHFVAIFDCVVLSRL
jgi:hemolysin III